MTVRLALAQIRPKKGDYAENVRRVGAVFAQAAGWETPPDLIVLPETIMSGYFVEGGVRDVAVSAGTLFRDLAAQHAAAQAPPFDVALGFYEEYRNRYYNSALYAQLGGNSSGVRHVHRKIFLPTYGVFDEERFVDAGRSVQAFDTAWGRAAMVICEDAWHSIVPTLAALGGAQILIVPSASPARGIAPTQGAPDCDNESRPQTVWQWERILQRVAEEHGVFVALAQLVGFEGGKGFQGSSVVIGPGGEVVARGPVFDEVIVTAALDLNDITRIRATSPLLADLEIALPSLLEAHTGRKAEERPAFGAATGTAPRTAKPKPADHPIVQGGSATDPLAIDVELTTAWLVAFLADEIQRRRGFGRGIVGLSGGVDSAVTASLAARALGPENVIGVRMPHRASSAESLEHAELVAKALGIELLTVDITQAVEGYSPPSRNRWTTVGGVT